MKLIGGDTLFMLKVDQSENGKVFKSFTVLSGLKGMSSSVRYDVRQLGDSPVHALRREEDFGQRFKDCICSKYFLGLIALILTVSLWLASSFLTADILQTYDKPFLMTYLNVLPLALYFVFLRTGDPLQPKAKRAEGEEEAGLKALPPLTTRQLALLALPFLPLYMLGCYLNNFAYSATSVSSAAIMGCTSTLFILLLGAAVRVERVTLLKCLAALLCMVGAGLLVWREWREKSMVGWGNLAGVGSALCYAGYSVYLKKAAGDESRVSQPILFAFVAAYSFLSLWPIFIVLHYTGVERFELPHTTHQYWAILANVFLGGLVPNFLWNVAFAWTSELVVSVGLACSLPLTLIGDRLWNHAPIGWVKGVAAFLVILGFIPINLATVFPEADRDVTACCDRRKSSEMSEIS